VVLLRSRADGWRRSERTRFSSVSDDDTIGLEHDLPRAE
jgi:hypothetical protein